MDLHEEKEHLLKADAAIYAADARIRRQGQLLGEMTKGGHDVTAAAGLLALFESVLRSMVAHRTLILKAIEDIEHGRR